MEIEIVRNLEGGADYAPDWRYQVVQTYLEEVAASDNPTGKMREICWMEKDPFVRQYLKFRFNGRSVANGVFQYAAGCLARNAASGAASMIKAMLVADRTPEEIARELGTAPLNVVTFAKMFFDVRRYLNNEAFLRRTVFSDVNKDMTAPEALRERRWLAAAFHRGWAGVEQVVLHRSAGTAEAIEELTGKLHATLTSRALEFAMELETSGAPPTEDDLKRFLAVQNVQAKQPVKETNERITMSMFLTSIHGDLLKKAENSSDPALKTLKELHSKPDEVASPVKRLRSRFGGS